MKYSNTIEEVKKQRVPAFNVDVKAVIVETEYKKGVSQYGVQYWSSTWVSQGTQKNTDGTISKFVQFFH